MYSRAKSIADHLFPPSTSCSVRLCAVSFRNKQGLASIRAPPRPFLGHEDRFLVTYSFRSNCRFHGGFNSTLYVSWPKAGVAKSNRKIETLSEAAKVMMKTKGGRHIEEDKKRKRKSRVRKEGK